MLDGAGRPHAIIETIELKLLKFGEVDAAFAFDEGEGDLTLAYWQDLLRSAARRWRGPFCPSFALQLDYRGCGANSSSFWAVFGRYTERVTSPAYLIPQSGVAFNE
jgi:hypothetical protein